MNSIDYLINELSNTKDFFTPSLVVFDNLKMEQWFKNYWLKNKQDIYMNIKCLRFKDLYYMIFKNSNTKILDQQMLTKYLLICLSTWNKKEVSYIYDGDAINASRLYEYAIELANLFIQYDNDLFTPSGFQKAIYDKVIEMALSDGYQTLNDLYQKGTMAKINNPLYIYVTRDLTRLEAAIITKYSNQFDDAIKVIKLDNNEDKKQIDELLIAPSSLREIEAIHTHICELIASGVRPNDIVVYAPDIQVYASDIEHVFKQGNELYPNVPYNLTKKLDNETWSFFAIIKKILINGYCTRTDFINILSNKMVCACHGIELDTLDTMISTIIDSNSYRDHVDANDWLDLKRRMLLSKIVGEEAIVSNIIKISDQKYLPYQNMDLTNDIIVKLITLIDLVDELQKISISDFYTAEVLDHLQAIIKQFLFKVEDFQYAKIAKELNAYRQLITKYECSISLKVVIESLLNLFKTAYVGKPLMGVSFLDIDEKAIINVPHTFIIGFSSNAFPRKETNPMIQQHIVKHQLDVETNIFNKIKNNTEHLYISYINIDLKNDEKFYPSPLLEGLTVKSKQEIDIDETRDKTKLYTKREFKNYSYYHELLEPKEATKHLVDDSIIQEEHKGIVLNQIASYLEDPLSTKAKLIINTYDDEEAEDASEQYEPMVIDPLIRGSIIQEIMQVVFLDKDIEKMEIVHQLRKNLPDYPFDYTEFACLVDNCVEQLTDYKENHPKAKLEKIDNLTLKYQPQQLLQDEIVLVQNRIIELKQEKKIRQQLIDQYQSYFEYLSNQVPLSTDEVSWTIKDCGSVIVEKVDNNYTYFDSKVYKNKKVGEMYIRMYVHSLLEAAKLETDDSITVTIITHKEKKDEGKFSRSTKKYQLNRLQAQHILNKIHYYLTDYHEIVFLNPFGTKGVGSLNDVVELAKAKWKFFSLRHMFDESKVFMLIDNGEVLTPKGDSFKKPYYQMLVKHRLLLTPIRDDKEEKK